MTDTSKNIPTHNVFSVTGDVSDNWLKIGVAWPNKDGKGFNISLSALPLGRMVMRLAEPKEQTPA